MNRFLVASTTALLIAITGCNSVQNDCQRLGQPLGEGVQLVDRFYGELLVDNKLTPKTALELANRMKVVIPKLERIQIKDARLNNARTSLIVDFKDFIWIADRWASKSMTTVEVISYRRPVPGASQHLLYETICR